MTEYNVSMIRDLVEASKKGRTGILKGSSPQKEISISFWQGEVVSVQSRKGMEAFPKYLLRNKVISELEFQLVNSDMQLGKSSAEGILSFGKITAKQLRKYQLRYQKYILSSSLEWSDLHVMFIPIERSAIRLDLSLGLKASFFTLLWEVISSSIPPNQIVPVLSDKKKGRFCFFEKNQDAMREFPLPANLTKIFHWGDRKLFLPEITAEVVDSSGALFQAIWLFEQLGLIVREKSLEKEAFTIDLTPDEQNLLILLEKEHGRLMSTDYYSFLRLEQDVSLEQIKDKCYRYFKNIHTFKEKIRSGVPKAFQYIQDLEQGLEMVLYSLGDEKRRVEYDRLLLLGEAEDIQAGRLSIPSIVRLIQNKSFENALKELKKYQKDHTAQAYRGWVRIKMGDAQGEREIIEVLRQNPRHIDALKLMARCCFEQKKYSQSKTYVYRLLTIDPRMPWALELKSKLE